jgi:DNA-binding transcriptional LysR family regulator
MIANLEALAALADLGTMTKAATRLRITQSAVSKRIAALEDALGVALVEPVGRGVRLTASALALLDKTSPFMAALKDALRDESPASGERLVIGVSESILASWGAQALSRVKARVPHLQLTVNAHRSPVAIDNVRAGEYVLALCAGQPEDAAGLTSELLLEEPMVIVPSGLGPLPPDEPVHVLTIENHSATWQALDRRIRAAARTWPFRVEVTQTLQSFAGITQMARHGLAHGLVPIGIARALAVPESALVRLPPPGLSRPVSLVGRSTSFSRPLVRTFREALVEETARMPKW